ncbi:MAG: ATP synthase F1 subunit delta [Flavobacteriales bacterium]|nr:ATP synthase F1 subunit delta [Flavobacteriales bacterium]
MRHSKIASRYAKSIFDLAIERNALDKAQIDMEILAGTIGESKDLQLLLKSPIIHADKKMNILKSVFGSQLGEISMKFVEIITNKGREGLLEDISNAFVIMAKERNNIFGAVVQTPVALSDAAREKIMSIVQGIRPGTIELQEVINKDLIGGFVLKVGDKMIDSSLASQLASLRREFTDNPYVAEY